MLWSVRKSNHSVAACGELALQEATVLNGSYRYSRFFGYPWLERPLTQLKMLLLWVPES